MGRREDSIAARRAALESQGRWRAQRKEKDDRCSDLGVAVVLAFDRTGVRGRALQER